MRRIITGHNADGKSVVMHEGPPARSIGEDVGGLYEIWNTEATPFTTKGFEDKADIDIEPVSYTHLTLPTNSWG